eukprot:911297-Prymnesium_polylepis.3
MADGRNLRGSARYSLDRMCGFDCHVYFKKKNTLAATPIQDTSDRPASDWRDPGGGFIQGLWIDQPRDWSDPPPVDNPSIVQSIHHPIQPQGWINLGGIIPPFEWINPHRDADFKRSLETRHNGLPRLPLIRTDTALQVTAVRLREAGGSERRWCW